MKNNFDFKWRLKGKSILDFFAYILFSTRYCTRDKRGNTTLDPFRNLYFLQRNVDIFLQRNVDLSISGETVIKSNLVKPGFALMTAEHLSFVIAWARSVLILFPKLLKNLLEKNPN